MQEEGITKKEADSKIWMVDSKGLITNVISVVIIFFYHLMSWWLVHQPISIAVVGYTSKTEKF